MASSQKTGVLLVNLGTPASPTTKAIKHYLTEFLHDRRVVDLSPFVWYPLLHGIILPKRAKRLSLLYQSIWLKEGSPLWVNSQLQQQALQALLPQLSIRLAMTYGSPSIKEGLEALSGMEHIIILPLYPQYSSSTTAAVWDAVYRYYQTQRYIPELSLIRDYADHPLYIRALTQTILHASETQGKPDAVLFSYHGIPKRYVDNGDDYEQRCQLTTDNVIKDAQLHNALISYQSQFGKEAWLQPYTNEVLQYLPMQGIKRLHVICPGFASDCIETLEEINVQGRKTFLASGGEHYHYIPALNAQALHIELLRQLILDAC